MEGMAMAREKKLQPFGETPESFRELKDDGVYYVDKMGFIPYLITQKRKICVVTCPRRFGKTLMLRMLQTFFEYRLRRQASSPTATSPTASLLDACAWQRNRYLPA
jgi:hypothetical protein